MKRAIYFLTERLQITSAERTSILVIGALFLLISGVHQFSSQASANIDNDSYSYVFNDFEQRVQGLERHSEEVIQQYYPAVNPDQPAAVLQPQTDTRSDKVEETETITSPAPVKEAASNQTAISEKININTADSSELVKLPGIGPAIAARIIEYRNENGPFRNIEDIKKVRGIGDARFEAIKDMITVADD